MSVGLSGSPSFGLSDPVTTEPEAVGLSAARLNRIAAAMKQYTTPDDRGIPEVSGISVLVHRRGHTVYADQFGNAERETNRALQPDAIFRIYSMTKPIVSTALMLLLEEGRFRLDHPVSTFVPGFAGIRVMAADGSLADAHRPVTVADLLTHTSGLTYDFAIDTPVGGLYREARIMNDMTRTLEDCIDTLATLPLAAQPGSAWIYSVGIDVAARLIEILADQPLHAFLAERIFEPLGMVDTGFGVAADQVHRVPPMYGLPDLVGRDYHFGHLVQAVADGFNERIDVSETYTTEEGEVSARGGVGLFSTAADYLRFARMLLNDGQLDGQRIIGRKTLELMHADHLDPALLPIGIGGIARPGRGFGLGSSVMIDVARSGGLGSVGEFGWSGAAKTNFWVDPAEDLTAVFMAQYMTGPQNPDHDFRNLVYQAIID